MQANEAKGRFNFTTSQLGHNFTSCGICRAAKKSGDKDWYKKIDEKVVEDCCQLGMCWCARICVGARVYVWVRACMYGCARICVGACVFV